MGKGKFVDDLKLYIRLLAFTRPYVGSILVLIFSVMLAAIMEPLLPALMKPLVDETMVGNTERALWEIPILLLAVVFFRGVADYGVTYASQYLATSAVQDIRQALFSKVMLSELEVYEGESPGRVLSRIIYDTYMVSEAITEVWMVAIKDSLVLIGLIIFLLYTSWQLSIFIFATAPVMVMVIRGIGHRLRRSSSTVQLRVAEVTNFIQESLAGIREIKIFNAGTHQSNKFYERSFSLRREQLRSARTSALAGPLVSLLTALTVSSVIYVASGMSAAGKLTPGEFISFITALAMIFGPIRKLTSINLVLQRGLAAGESIFEILDARGELQFVKTQESTFRETTVSNEVNRSECRGHLVFDRVFFRYPGNDRLVLENCCFEVSRGEALAIVGPSGSGKSTIIELIARFRSPTSGLISLDGTEIGEIDLQQYRSNIALVSQRINLFDGSIEDNIRLGNLNATIDELHYAIEAANATDFIDALPNGLKSPLGSLGNRLSGGQRQRIALARAFLKNAPILVLDEITSALDRESETHVLRAVERLMVGRTVILVSHAPERLRGITKSIELL